MSRLLVRHDELLRHAVERFGGTRVRHGRWHPGRVDLPLAVVEAAVHAELALHEEGLGGDDALRVRMGVHTGEGEPRDGDYYGAAVNLAARLCTWRTAVRCWCRPRWPPCSAPTLRCRSPMWATSACGAFLSRSMRSRWCIRACRQGFRRSTTAEGFTDCRFRAAGSSVVTTNCLSLPCARRSPTGHRGGSVRGGQDPTGDCGDRAVALGSAEVVWCDLALLRRRRRRHGRCRRDRCAATG